VYNYITSGEGLVNERGFSFSIVHPKITMIK